MIEKPGWKPGLANKRKIIPRIPAAASKHRLSWPEASTKSVHMRLGASSPKPAIELIETGYLSRHQNAFRRPDSPTPGGRTPQLVRFRFRILRIGKGTKTIENCRPIELPEETWPPKPPTQHVNKTSGAVSIHLKFKKDGEECC